MITLTTTPIQVPPELALLKYGDKGQDVKVLQALLQRQGYFAGAIGGNFLRITRDAVRTFQMQHMDSKGQWLDTDGIVGDATWWALYNPDGEHQRSHISAKIPTGLPDYRANLLATALEEHRLGVKEVPDGSNWGDGVTKYLKGVGPAPWCCFFASWTHKETTGDYIYKYNHGHVLTLWRAARDRQQAKYKSRGYAPIPGDLFVMLYRNRGGDLTGSGHIGWVLRTDQQKVKAFNTVEGNAGNRVKQGVRNMDQGTLFGFINLFDDAGNVQCDTGLITGESTDGSTR